MQITDSSVGDVTLAVLDGRLDTASVQEAEQRLAPLVGGRGLVLDLSGVRFISSAGLRVLLKLVKAAKAARVGFAVFGVQPAVREVFEISGFLQIIPTFDARKDALDSIG